MPTSIHDMAVQVRSVWEQMGSPAQVLASDIADRAGVETRFIGRSLSQLGFIPPNPRHKGRARLPQPWTAPDRISPTFTAKDSLRMEGFTDKQTWHLFAKALKRPELIGEVQLRMREHEEPVTSARMGKIIEEVLNEKIDYAEAVQAILPEIGEILGMPWLADPNDFRFNPAGLLSTFRALANETRSKDLKATSVLKNRKQLQGK